MTTRAEVVAAARAWLGTPFGHQQRMKGVAVDCAGLVIGVCRELGIVAPDFDVNGYARTPDGSMLAYCDRHMTRIEQSDMEPGDVILVRFDAQPQHMGILVPYRYGGLAFVQAVPRGVIETRLMFGTSQRSMKFVAAYALPGVE